MGGFVFAAVLLGLLAVAFAVSALWQRAPRLALVVGLLVPLAAGGLYLLVGRPAALDPANVTPPKTMEDAVAQLERSIAGEPESFANLVVLARAQMALGKFDAAQPLYKRALALQPANADVDVSVEYAEAQLRASPDRRFPPAAVALLEAAVANNPTNQRALFFLGLQRMQARQPAEATRHWERLLPLLPPDAAEALRPQVVAARSAAGLPPLPEAAPAPGLEIEVDIDPTLAKFASPGDALFVFAHAAEGRGPPLAAKRVAVDAFPVRLRLTDADSPMPAAVLSSAPRVLVQARLSKSGQATGSSGDLEADAVMVAQPTKERATLVLSRTRP